MAFAIVSMDAQNFQGLRCGNTSMNKMVHIAQNCCVAQECMQSKVVTVRKELLSLQQNFVIERYSNVERMFFFCRESYFFCGGGAGPLRTLDFGKRGQVAHDSHIDIFWVGGADATGAAFVLYLERQ